MNTVRVVCGHDCPDMCSLIATVQEGRVTKIVGDPKQPFTAGFACGKVMRDTELVHSPRRLATPLRRTGAKGEGKFVPISWDEALDEIATRWKSIIAESGPSALLGYAYSAHQGLINRGLTNGLFHALGTSRLQAGTVCDTCCETAWELTMGPVGSADPEAVSDADFIVSWGADLMAVNVHVWARVEEAKKKGVKVVVIDPRRTKTAERADWHIQINIGTDAAFALGVAHILVRDKKCDRAYLEANTLGFDKLEQEVLPRFTPEATAKITGIAVADIERFAAMYAATKKSFIRLGEGMTRLVQGGQALRAVLVLPAMTGAYGVQGGGALLLSAGSIALDYNAVRKPSGPATARMVNHLRLGDALLNTQNPPLRGLFIAANNPAITCPEVAKVRKGLAREDLFTVVHDPFMTATARYADIVLPATTYLETEDLFRSYGSYYMQYAKPAIAPVGEARSNFAVTQALAQRMGLADDVFRMPVREIAARLLKGGHGPTALDITAVENAGPIKVKPAGTQKYATPSGKLEIYSEQVKALGISPLPDWQPDPEDEREAAKWPLRLLTAPSYFQPHTTYAAVDFLRGREGEPWCVLHPEDAAKRKLADGQKVALFNDRGRIGLVLKVADEIRPGVVLVPGQRPDEEAVHGTINMLCSDRYTDLGEGATYQSTWLDVQAWSA